MAKAKTKTEAKAKPVAKSEANAKLVAAIQKADQAMNIAKSALATVATLVQQLQLNKSEVIASYMVARGCTESTAVTQYSRIAGLLKNPKVLADLREGNIDLKVAMQKITTRQQNPNEEQKKARLEKKFNSTIAALMKICKEGGYDRESLLLSIKAAAKKEGL